MTAHTNLGLSGIAPMRVDPERGHKTRVHIAWSIAIALIVGIAAYGYDYYTVGSAARAFSSKHVLLRPSGKIGVKLGILALTMFAGLFLYALRKKVAWLGKLGKAKHWLDFHIVLGTVAPIVVAFHASFKFRGIAGMAFWIMVAVALSGVVGRYIYAQIPRSLNSTELSLKDIETMEQEMTDQLATQKVISARQLEPLFRLPARERVLNESAVAVLFELLSLDIMKVILVARLRTNKLGALGVMTTLGGLLPTKNEDLEAVIRTARRKSTLTKRAVFLERTQQVFHLWHVVHRPFSYSFAVLALLHVSVAMLLGFL